MGELTLAETYTVDLRAVEGEGAFPCPRCRTVIAPDDLSEESYTVIGVKENGEGFMEEMTIQCLQCKSEIRLIGFIELKESW